MARASHGMHAAAQDTVSRILTTSTEAGVAARDMGRHRAAAAPPTTPTRSIGLLRRRLR